MPWRCPLAREDSERPRAAVAIKFQACAGVLGYLRDEEECTMATQQQLEVSRATDEGRAIATLTIAFGSDPVTR
jgi:hypothetical protein